MKAKIDALTEIVQIIEASGPAVRPQATGRSVGEPRVHEIDGVREISPASPPKAAPPSTSPEGERGLVNILRIEISKGQNLWNELPTDPFGLAIAEYNSGLRSKPPTSPQDIAAWRDRVSSLLRDYPAKRTRFEALPVGPSLQLAATSILSGPEDRLRKEVAFQLKVLREIVQELDPPK
jgi:hypothetical protein